MALRLGETSRNLRILARVGAAAAAAGGPFTVPGQIDVLYAIGQKVTDASPLAVQATIVGGGTVIIGEVALWAGLCAVTIESGVKLTRKIVTGVRRRSGPENSNPT